MTTELNLVVEVEKHECLYNFKLPDYSRKDVTEKAWLEVSRKAELSVDDCKEKWRNIRSSFLRSMKPLPSGSKKARKPYYLKDRLQFVLPYVKPVNIAVCTETSIPGESDDDDDGDNDVKPIIVYNETSPVPAQSQSTQTERSPTASPRRKRTPEIDSTYLEYLKNKNKTRHTEEITKNNAMRYFLLSLLPEFETMAENQIRAFKIKVMMLIDELKSGSSQSTPISYSATSSATQ